MFYISDVQTISPRHFINELQFLVYKTLDELKISFERVDTDEAITMEDCTAINEKLDMKMVKTLFLCTRHQQEFFLFITSGEKRFDAKTFSQRLEISRVSFAPQEFMINMLGTKVGAATVFSMLLDSAKPVRVVFDEDVLKQEYYGCSDGTTTGYMKIKTADILEVFLPVTGHGYETV